MGKFALISPDVYTYRDALKHAVPDDARCIILNDISYCLFSYQIDKWGYVFNGDKLPASWVDGLVASGVAYLYSDSRVVDENPELQRYFDTLLTQQGDVRVFRLKMPADSLRVR